MSRLFAWIDDVGLRPNAYLRTVLGSQLVPLGLGVIALVWAAIVPGSTTTVLALGISAIFVVGYQVFVGSTGIVSFGHMAFAAIGGYATAILTTPVAIKGISLPDIPLGLGGIEWPLLPSLLVGGLLAAIVALLSGFALMRLTGAAAGVSTLALLLIVNEVLRNADAFTRGTQTFYGVPGDLNPVVVYLVLAVAVLIAVAFKFSSEGLKARAVRDAPLAAETGGVRILRGRLVAWTLSAFITAIGGGLYVHLLTAFSPNTFDIGLAIPIIVMGVLGGLNSASGAVIGAVLLTIWLEFMRGVEGGSLFGLPLPEIHGLSQLTVGIGLIVILRFRPRGLLDNKEPQFRPGPRS